MNYMFVPALTLIKNKRKRKMKDFSKTEFTDVNFSIFGKLEDDGFIIELQGLNKKKYDKEDFEYCNIITGNKEKIKNGDRKALKEDLVLVKEYNKENKQERMYINEKNGVIILVRTKKGS